jgi:hypothetical protein
MLCLVGMKMLPPPDWAEGASGVYLAGTRGVWQ